MKKRFLLPGLVIGIVLLTGGLVSGETARRDGLALFRVAIQSETETLLAKDTVAVLYARLSGEDGPYLLVGAPVGHRWSADLDVTLLDSVMSNATYVVAYSMPGQALNDIHNYGTPLVADNFHVLLRTGSPDVARLGEAGFRVRLVTLDPKPLQPLVEETPISGVTEPDPLIQAIIDRVDSTTVYSYTAGLSGEWAVDIGGTPYTITTRHTDSGESIHQATQYVGEHLSALGLEVEYHEWDDTSNPNVVGQLTGKTNPEKVYIIGAHLDDKPNPPSVAPGADDNASGSVAVLLAADILTKVGWECTLRFALWTGEEQGLLGSGAYAERSYDRGEQIAGYLNLDMIAYNSGMNTGLDLHADPSIPNTLTLTQVFSDVVKVYDLDLIPEIVPDGIGSSDHASFWDYGVNAILVIEDLGDFNPHYHTSEDLLEHVDMAYYTDMVKASVGTFAHMSDCLIRDGIGYLDGRVTGTDGAAAIPGAQVSAVGEAGNVLASQTDSTGYYTRTLVSGTYTVTVQATQYFAQTANDITVTEGEVTTLNASLTPWPRSYLPLMLAFD